jgi:secreted trypsin-like serine protease
MRVHMRRLAWLGAIGSWRWGGARCLLTMVFAMVLGLAVAVPVFAADRGVYQPQVVGGTAVPYGKYPFMVSLQADKSNARLHRGHYCGGSLIDRNSVLTAAHCVSFISKFTTPLTLSFRDVRIVVGGTVLNSKQGQSRRIQKLSDISIHPRFNENVSPRYDAAVIKLGTPVTKSALALAKTGSNRLEHAGRLATIAGWGTTRAEPVSGSAGSNIPDRMQEARVPLVSDASCEGTYKGAFFPAVMVCAGEKGMGVCHGDSGGPMWATTSGGRRQIGITSGGKGCATARYPDVFTEVNAPDIKSFIRRAANR